MDNSYTFSFFEKKDNYRKSVPKTVKDRLWDTTFGPEAGQGLCYVCGLQINSKRFEAGHIISVYHGGSTTLDNLKCICSTCNKSMGTQNLENFKLTYFPAIRKTIKNKHENKCNCCCHHKTNDIEYNCNEFEPKLTEIKKNNFIYKPSTLNKQIEQYITMSNSPAKRERQSLSCNTISEPDYDTDEEELQKIKNIKLDFLNKYRYVPK